MDNYLHFFDAFAYLSFHFVEALYFYAKFAPTFMELSCLSAKGDLYGHYY